MAEYTRVTTTLKAAISDISPFSYRSKIVVAATRDCGPASRTAIDSSTD
jgi:hypothetical protein